MDSSLWVEGELMSQPKEFKYLWVLFTSDRKMEYELDRQFGAALKVMEALYQTVVCCPPEAFDLPVNIHSNQRS